MPTPPKTKYDPLEAAKVTVETSVSDDVTAKKTDWGKKQPQPPATPPPLPPAPKVAAKAPVAPQGNRYEVLERKLVSLGAGGMHTFKAGDVLDPVGYGGEAGLERLGLKLKKIES